MEEGGTFCIFCKIVANEASAAIVMEDEQLIAFMDRYPINLGHILVIPKKHYETIMDMPPHEVGRLFEKVWRLARAVFRAVGAHGLNIGQSNGRAASQEVPHVHVHIIPRFEGDVDKGFFPHRKLVSFAELEREAERLRHDLGTPSSAVSLP